MPAEETPPLPPAADAPPRQPTGADLPAEAAPAVPPVEAASPDIAGEPALSGALSPAAPHRRRRRRRRPPRGPGDAPRLAAAGDAVADDAATDAEAAIDEAGPNDETRAAAADPVAAGQHPASDAAISRPRRHRRRRRPFGGFGPSPTPGGLGSALPPSDAVAAADAGEAGPDGVDRAADAGGGSGRPTLRLRRPVRGRRQLPRPPGLQRGAGEALAEGGAAPPHTAAAAADGAPAAESDGFAPRPASEFPRRRRRRRPPTRGSDTAPSAEGEPAAPAPQPTDRARQPRARNRPDGAEARHEPRDRHSAAPQDRAPGGGRRDNSERSRGRGDRNDRGERGREAPRRFEQKLYALEAMVDRGFEDLPDEGEENGSRRVHWTIVKRSVADQKSGKAMSATYVLQREGGETEFGNLGAARAAANKTIVHPEKLTLSKAEHAAAKNSK